MNANSTVASRVAFTLVNSLLLWLSAPRIGGSEADAWHCFAVFARVSFVAGLAYAGG